MATGWFSGGWILQPLAGGLLRTEAPLGATLGATQGFHGWLWGTAMVLLILTTVVVVLLLTGEITVGRLIGIGLVLFLTLSAYLVEGRYGLVTRLVSGVNPEEPAARSPRSGRPRDPGPPAPFGDPSRSRSSEDRRVDRSQDVFEREARRRRERRQRQAERRRRTRASEPDPASRRSSSEEPEAPRVLGGTRGEGDARTQRVQVPVEWALKWRLPEQTRSFRLTVVQDSEAVRTVDVSNEESEGSTAALPPGRYHFEVRSDGPWELRLVEASS